MTLLTGGLLIAVGLIIGLASDSDSLTRFIPAVFGVPFALLGLLAIFNGRARKHAIHAALALALILAVLAGYKALGSLGAEGAQLKLASQGATVVICLIYVALGVQSFRAARRRRKVEA